ncbi:MAG: hypothetical protein ACM3O4_00330 [Ignavibacteriales bacterium]
MRKLGKANKKSFTLFAIIVIFIISIFVFGVAKVLSYEKTEYKVTSNSFIYDEEYNYVPLENDGIISKSWNGKYYLNISDKDNKYSLGKETVVFNPNDYKMYLYGEAYQIFTDGNILKKVNQTEIIRSGSPSFYKLADRKYLIVDKNIFDEKGKFSATEYLIVVIDKIGNALLMNNKVNIKTINPIILKTSEFSFDIANEKIIVGKEEIDLKKVIGSTNQYVEELTKKDNNKSNSGNNNNNNNNSGNNNGGFNPSIQIPKPIKLIKNLNLQYIEPGITYLDVAYIVNDPSNQYTSVFLIIDDGVKVEENNQEQGNIVEEGEEEPSNTNRRININKESNSYRIRDLKPNTEYNVSIGYTYIEDDNGFKNGFEQIYDVIKVRTQKPDFSLQITKVSDSKVYFNFKTNPNYSLDFGIIALYVDEVRVSEIDVNLLESISSKGWSSSLDNVMGGYEITLKLENTSYNNSQVNLGVQCKYINY